MDGTIPRAALPLVLSRMREMSRKYGLQVANVFLGYAEHDYDLILDALIEAGIRILYFNTRPMTWSYTSATDMV